MSQYLGFDPTTNMRSYLFVSYDSGDAERIAPILTSLHNKGVEMWYDHGIEYGENWSGQLAERIGQSSAVLMFISKTVFNREESFVYKEYIMAKEFYKKSVYAVILDNIEKDSVSARWLPWWIEMRQKQCVQAWKADTNDSIAAMIESAVTPSPQKASDEYRILEDLQKQGERLNHAPAGYRYIRLLVFAIMDSDGNRFIPFQYPRYGSIWTTPHIDFSLPPPQDKRLTDVSKILRHFDKWMREYADIFDILENQRLYQMGMFNAESKMYEAFTEYKISPTLLDRYHCYRVDEYHVTYIDPDEIINIYDPEKLHGYRYFPLNREGFADSSSQYVECSGENIYFFGKKLSTNIVRLLSDNQRFSDCTFRLPDDVRIDENGFIDAKGE